ncbi:DUF4189 domain-containing protein [Microcoleus sp. herbarium7]|uniref:DUF4189 domain-containing protein n=1 Tax=Microcoleus sp. herbarium7 TaxID=3055435 RepID=UPI002FD10ED9
MKARAFSVILMSGVLALPLAVRADHVCTNSPNEVFVGMTPAGQGQAAMPICRWIESEESAARAAPPVIITRYQVWEDRWGAIAIDAEGVMGVAEAQKTRDEAVILAHADCVARGGDTDRCRNMALVYTNSCAASAWGGGSLRSLSLPTKTDAEIEVVKQCSELAGVKCRLTYSGCSESVDVGYCPAGVKPPDSRCSPPRDRW